MQSEDEICAQVPPTIEELDKMMECSENDETAPPSPSLIEEEKKENHLPPMRQIPYPMDILDIQELANAPVQEWNALLPKRGNRLEMFYPEL